MDGLNRRAAVNSAMLLPIYPTASSTEVLMKALIQLLLLVTLYIYINVNNVVLIYHELSKRESDQPRQTEHNKDIITGIKYNKKIKQRYHLQRVTNVLHFHIICICSKSKDADMSSRL